MWVAIAFICYTSVVSGQQTCTLATDPNSFYITKEGCELAAMRDQMVMQWEYDQLNRPITVTIRCAYNEDAGNDL